MQSLDNALPPIWSLQEGETPTPAHEAAAALQQLASDAQAASEPMLAQLGAADDAAPEAIALGLRLQQLLTDAAAVAVELQAVAPAR
jgi:hypothetical protein